MRTHPYPKPYVLALALLALPQLARASVVVSYDRNGRALYCASKDSPKTRIRAANGRGADVHPAAAQILACVVRGLENAGLRIASIGGYACRAPLGRAGSVSNHPRGLAIDVNQYARDLTNPTVPRRQGVQIAQACNAVSGAIWHSPDNGHFEIRSLPRSARPVAAVPAAPAAAYPGKRYYYPDDERYSPGKARPQPKFYFPILSWLIDLFKGNG